MEQSELTLSVIVPVFNERRTLRRVLERVRAVPIRKQIVIVDDGSTDGTTDVLRAIIAEPPDDRNRLQAIFQQHNQGKGAAIRAAIPHLDGDITLIQDADLEYDPAEYPALVAPILAGHADVVYGSRFLGSTHRVLLFRHTMGNKLLTFVSNLCTDLNLTDMETCYKVFRTDLLRRMRLTSDRFGIEPELTAKVARLGYRLYEVPISYHGREYWEGKKIGWKDGVSAIWTIVKHSLADRDDDAGFTTLQRLRHVGRYNEWVWTRLAPYVGDRVLEVGCGVGNFTRFLRDREHVVVTDNNEVYLQRLRRALDRVENVRVCNVDWGDPELDGLRGERFDTILCLNVLEHIEDDDAALATFARLLDPGGRLVLQVPAMRALYGEIDRAIHHHRRYERHDLVAQLQGHGFVVEDASYFNLPGVLGWWLNSVVLKRRAIPGLQSRIANLLVPWLRFEQRLRPNRGMALLAVARKTRDVETATKPFAIPESIAH